MAIPYDRYWKLPEGRYPYKVFFYENDNDEKSTAGLFPMVSTGGAVMTRQDFVYQAVINSINIINDLDLGIEFVYDGTQTTDVDSYYGGIHHVTKVQSRGVASSLSGLAVRMGISVRTTVNGYRQTLHHEMLHNLGFDHKDKLIRESDAYRFDARYTLSNDDIMGLDVKYQNPNTRVVAGNIGTRDIFEQMIAYLVNENGILCYQAPVWPNGDYEFRLRNNRPYWVLVLARYVMEDQSNFYSIDGGLRWKAYSGKINGVDKPIVFI